MNLSKVTFVDTMKFLIAALGGILSVMFLYLLRTGLFFSDPWLIKLAQNKFPVIIGLPVAGLCSSFVILTFDRLIDGKIEFKISNSIELTGPTAPILLWMICFLVISFCINMLWKWS